MAVFAYNQQHLHHDGTALGVMSEFRTSPFTEATSTDRDVLHSTSNPLAANWAQDLLDVAQFRDQAAYARLFSYFAPRLKHFAIKLLANEQQALEMVQDTMLNVWKKAHLYDVSKGAASTWIYTIARNVRFDMLRKDAQRKENIDADMLWQDTEKLPDSHRSHEDAPETGVMVEAMLQHLDKLPAKQLEVIQKVYLEEKTHQEVCEELGIPLGTVKSRIRLALCRLKEVIEHHD